MKTQLYLFVTFLFVACNGNQNQKLFEKERVVKEVEQMLSNYFEDIRKNGLTAEFEYLDNSNDFFWIPPGYNATLKYDSIKNIIKQNAKSFELVELEWDTLEVFPLSDKIASYSGIINGQMVDTAGVKTKMKIIESGTTIKRAKGWKLLNGQTTLLPERNKKEQNDKE